MIIPYLIIGILIAENSEFENEDVKARSLNRKEYILTIFLWPFVIVKLINDLIWFLFRCK